VPFNLTKKDVVLKCAQCKKWLQVQQGIWAIPTWSLHSWSLCEVELFSLSQALGMY